MRSAVLVVLVCVASGLFAQEPAPKAAIPDEAAQKAASKVVGDVYKPDYEKAKTPSQKIDLAKKLLEEGEATKDDPVGRFVLFRIAREIAAQQGDLAVSFDAIGRIARDFEVDKLQMQVDAATVAVKASRTPKDHQACAAMLTRLIDEAIAADRYDLAKSLAALTLGAAREGRDADRIKQLTAKLKEVEEVAVEYEKVKEAKAALDAKPTDPAANSAVGKFLCLVKGDWKRGITMLALSDNEQFKAAALLELEAQPDSLKVGDAWWKVTEGLEATAKSRAQDHAGEWYRKALPGLSGLTKARVEKLVAQATAVNPNSGSTAGENAKDPMQLWKKLVGTYATGNEGQKKQGLLLLATAPDGTPLLRRETGIATKGYKFFDGVWLFDWGNVDLHAYYHNGDGTLVMRVFWKECSNGFEKAALPKRNPDREFLFVPVKQK